MQKDRQERIADEIFAQIQWVAGALPDPDIAFEIAKQYQRFTGEPLSDVNDIVGLVLLSLEADGCVEDTSGIKAILSLGHDRVMQ